MKATHKKIKKANLKVESAFGVFRKASEEVLNAIKKLETVVAKSEVNVAELNERIREEEEVMNVALSHIDTHKTTLDKLSKFLP